MKNLRFFILILFLLFVLTACNKNKIESQENYIVTNENKALNINQAADRLEIYYFHRTQRCISCLTIGEYVNKIMLGYFFNEVANGKIDYQEINIDLPENRDLARKFQATGSSLFINTIRGEKEDIQNVPEVWNLKNDEEKFKIFLEQKIDKLLGK